MKKRIVFSGLLFVMLASMTLIGFTQYVIYQIVKPFETFSVVDTLGNLLDGVGTLIAKELEK